MGQASRWKKRRAVTFRPPSKQPWEFVRPEGAEYFYRYGSAQHLDWLEGILLRHQLYFPTPSQLDDDREARPRLAAPSREALMRFLMHSFEQHHAAHGRRWVDRELIKMEAVFSNETKDDLLARLKKVFFGESNKNRILSLSLRADIEDLWRRYGDQHRGYCLEFQNGGVFQLAYLVQYSNEEYVFDVTDPNAATAHFFYHKTTQPVDWSVQQEARIVTFPRGGPALQSFDPRLLRRIILGREMPETPRDRIRSMVAGRVPPMLVEVEAS